MDRDCKQKIEKERKFSLGATLRKILIVSMTTTVRSSKDSRNEQVRPHKRGKKMGNWGSSLGLLPQVPLASGCLLATTDHIEAPPLLTQDQLS